MKKIILIGHSHTNCIYAVLSGAYREKYLTRRVHMLDIVSEMKKQTDSKKISLSDRVVAKINDTIKDFPNSGKWYSRDNTEINIILLLGGSFHHMLGLMKSDPPFDFVHPKYPDLDLDDDAEIIPYNAIRELLSPDIEGHEKIIKSIVNNFSLNTLHLGFPPTIHDADMMMSNIEPFFKEKYGKPELAHPNLRFKLWRLYSEMYCEMCNTLGIPFLQVPEALLENKMFLSEEAYGDSMHANQTYAKQYIDLFDSKLI